MFLRWPSMISSEAVIEWEGEYQVVLINKRRRKTLYVQLRSHIGEVNRKLAEQ